MEDSKPRGLAAFALDNPYLVIVACLLAAIFGVLSLVLLPKDLLPASKLPAVQILSFYPGMPVEHVEKNLTARYERYTGQAIGMERQESKSLVGVSIVKNFFGPSTDLNTAIAQTTSLTMSVLRRLPPGTQPPLILPFDPMAAVPLALVAVGTDRHPHALYDVARYDVRNAVQAIPGAMAPTVMGGAERQVLIYTDAKKLRDYNLSPLSVMDKLSHLNTFIPTGDVKIGAYDYQILSNGLVDRISDMNDFPIRSENGVSVSVKDVASAEDASKIQTNVVSIDGRPELYVPIYRQPGANSLEIVDETKKAVAALQDRLPEFSLKVVADQSVFIRRAIRSISEEAVIGGGLAALLVLLFLGNPRATFGILLSLPLSLLCAFLGLKATGQSLNAMTLGGLALSIGVLVDNSIVVLENISKKISQGAGVRHAALEGASEVAMPVLSSTLATLVVFFPVLFLKGIVRILFAALAGSVLFAMGGSYLCAMTVMPLFASVFLRKKDTGAGGGLLAGLEGGVEKLTALYGAALRWALRRSALVLLAVAGLAAWAARLAPGLGSELFPRADAGNLILELRLPSGTRIEKTQEFAQQMEKRLREWIAPEDLAMVISNAGVYYGFPAAFTPNSGPQDVFFNVELTQERRRSSQDYARILRERISKEYPGVEMGIELGGLLSSALNGGLRAPIDVQVEGGSLEADVSAARDLARSIKALRGAVDVRVQQRLDAPAFMMDVDRGRAARMGLSVDEIVKNVVSAISGSATFNPAIWVDPKNGIDYFMGVQFPERSIESLRDLERIPVTSAYQNRSVPLGEMAKISPIQVASEINHVNLHPVADIFLDAQDRDIGSLSRDIQKVIDRAPLPKQVSVRIRGETQSMRESVGALGGGFILAAVLVYLILVAQFRSFLVPLVMMAAVPLGMVGVVLMLHFTGTYFSIQAAIGAIFMIGIAVANGVLLIEFIQHHTRLHGDIETAVVGGACARLRPILMTSLASVLGLVPMAVGLGHGSEANIPLGRAVIGGQLVSTFLTLFVVPLLFSALQRRADRPRPRERDGGPGAAPLREAAGEAR